MIKLEISTALSLYLLFFVVGLLVVWFMFEKNFKFKNISIKEKFIWKCHICFNVYVDSISDEISACPFCKSYNKRLKTEG